jgi:hypothetical protein
MLRRSAFLFLSLLSLLACTGSDSSRNEGPVPVAAAASVSRQPEPASLQSSPEAPRGDGDASAASAAPVRRPVLRGIYINRFAAQSRARMASLMRLADTTEINAFVIDVKDEFGLNIRSGDSLLARNSGTYGSIREVRSLLDTLRQRGIVPVARIVVFKDSVAARANPDWTIRREDGSIWRDREGLAWVNPYDARLWEYNIRVAEEAARLGFEEIQWDYIRFPEPYKTLPPQVFPGSNGVTKPEVLARFLATARTRLAALGVGSTADIFGLVATVNGTLEIGQKWETLAPHVDVLLPMVYPSHYPRGAFGVDRPNAEPYKVVYAATARARERNEALGIAGESVRPWLQAFTLGEPAYGADHVTAQKKAVYDAGFEGWVLWHPGSKYEAFAAALEPRLEPRSR